jgi:integrase
LPKIGNVKIKALTPQVLDNLFKNLSENAFNRDKYKVKDKTFFDGIRKKDIAEKSGICVDTIFKIVNGRLCSLETAEKIAAAADLPFKKAFALEYARQGLSAESVKTYMVMLSACFAIAVKKQIIKENPCKYITLPKRSEDEKAANYLDEKQCVTFLQAVKKQGDFQIEVIFNLLLATGLRCGEMAALSWSDIDFTQGLLNVRHTLTDNVGILELTEPKTKCSKRTIKLPLYILQLLEKHKQTQVYNPLDMVFTDSIGGYYRVNVARNKLRAILKENNLPDMTLHGLRHTHASILINSDISALTVSEILGHKQAQTTLNIYSHIFEDTKNKALKAVEMKLFNEIESN